MKIRVAYRLCWIRTAAAATVALALVAHGQEVARGDSPLAHDRMLYISCDLCTGGQTFDAEVALKLTAPAEPAQALDQVVALPDPLAPIHIKEYLPKAVRTHRAVPLSSQEGDPTVRLSVNTSAQSHQRWLVANNIERNKLASPVGTWWYMAVDDLQQRDRLLAEFSKSRPPPPQLIVQRMSDGRCLSVPATVGKILPIAALECTIAVQRLQLHCPSDQASGRPRLKNDNRCNPAALVGIEYEEEREDRWIFANPAEFPPETGGNSVPFRLALDYPLTGQGDSPDFFLVTIGHDAHEVWTRLDGEMNVSRLSIGELIDIPKSQATFHLATFHFRARLLEEYIPTDEDEAVTTLRIETTLASGPPQSTWLELRKPKTLQTPAGPLTLVFGSRHPRSSTGRQ